MDSVKFMGRKATFSTNPKKFRTAKHKINDADHPKDVFTGAMFSMNVTLYIP